MPKYLLPCLCALFSSALLAQAGYGFRLDWQEPTPVEWEGERRTILTYRLLAEDSTYAPPPHAAERSGMSPSFLAFVPARSGATYAVEVVSLDSRPLPARRLDTSVTDKTFAFTYTPTRLADGRWVGKISGPSVVADGAGARQLSAITLRLRPDARPGATAALKLNSFAANSVLRQGDLYRITVPEDGVYRLSRDFLANELKVTGLEAIDPRNIKIYGQPGGMLPENITPTPPDDLREIPIVVSGQDDGRFDGGDYILLHARGPHTLTYDEAADRFRYRNNIYTNESSYFIQFGTSGAGTRVQSLNQSSGGEVVETNRYDAIYHLEEDLHNVLNELGGNSHGSGQQWFGPAIEQNRELNFPNAFTIPGLLTDEPVEIRARMALRSEASSRYFVSLNDGENLPSSVGRAVRFGRQEQSNAAYPTELFQRTSLGAENVRVTVTYPRPNGIQNSMAWLDYVQLVARRRLVFAGNQFYFRDRSTRDRAQVRYRFENPPADARVWRVTDNDDLRQAGLEGGSFTAPAGGTLHEYVAFRDNGNLPSPRAVGRIDNQNLHALQTGDMLIVTHPDFATQARELAEHRRAHNGFTVHVATTQEVYNEFSGGRDDPAAIRNMVRMLHERDPNLRYLLLFGDGSFDHRDVYEQGTNFIPTYQYQSAFTEVESFPSDDFYGIVTPSEQGQPLGPDLTVAVGRLPVKSADEASPLVAKLRRYDTDPSTLGDWRTRMVFVGDDEDGGIHTRDVNRVANAAEARKPDLNFDKLYFDLFPQQSLSAGDRYPDITEGLDRAVFRGALAVTYLGHGGPRGWAQERVLTIPQVRNWTRPEGTPDPIQPPLFITATCTFSNYDDASFTSAGEEALLTPRGGVIGLMTTTRPVFARRNYQLTNNTVLAMTERVDGGWRSLGDIIRVAKNVTTPAERQGSLSGDTENVRKFTLLGDPATVLAFPEYGVRTTRVDTAVVSAGRLDTVRALQQMRISGEVIDRDGNLLTDFNGQVYPTIYDKTQTVPTLAQDPGSPRLEIDVQRNIVFRGRATVSGGKFSFEFVVPNDIDYQFGAGKVSYYASDPAQFIDAAGFYDQLIIGGTGNDVADNNEGPQVEVYLDDTDFQAGDQVNEDATLLLHLSDDLGINVTGNSIGHDLQAVIDGDTRNAIVLNDYYEADVDNFRSGKVRYPLFDLEPGRHTLSVRAWDVANNSTEVSTEFVVSETGEGGITRIFNYPNPFTTNTCFQFDHSLVGEDVEAIVQIYTVSGRLVKTLEQGFSFSDGSVRRDDCMEWDGLDDYGDQLARGVYLYQVRLRGGGRILNSDMQKLVVLR